MRGPSGSFRQTARLGSSRRKVKQPVDFFLLKMDVACSNNALSGLKKNKILS